MAWQVEWLILWKMIVKMLTHIHMVVYTWRCWHICQGEEVGVDVDQLDEEMEAKGETSPAECTPVECGQFDGATGALYRKDRVSQSAPDASHAMTGRWVLRPVSGSSEGTGVGLRPDASVESDLTRKGRVWSGMMYTDAVARA